MVRALVAMLAALLGLSLVAPCARADDGALTREQVREEIEAYVKDQKSDFRVFWKEGLKFETRDGKVKAALGGRVMLDFTFFDDADPALEAAIGDTFDSGVQFRRVWLEPSGQVTDYVAWLVQLGFEVGTEVRFWDVWVKIQNLKKCLGCLAPDVRFGHTQEPIGLAWLTPSKFFQMTAWPLPTITFTPGYNTGVTAHSTAWGERATLQVGWYGTNSGVSGSHEWQDGQAVTGRVTFLPWAPCDDKCRLLHLGAGASYRFDLTDVRFRSRPDLDLGPYIVDTGTFGAADELFVDLEAALVFHRFSIQGEWMWTKTDATMGTDPTFWGGYVQASWLIGARCRKYDRKTGVFAGVDMCSPFDCTKGFPGGAWELVVRYDHVDLDDGDKHGGRCRDLVLGANWWLNTNARVMLNYVRADVQDAFGDANGDGAVNAVVVRLQVHW